MPSTTARAAVVRRLPAGVRERLSGLRDALTRLTRSSSESRWYEEREVANPGPRAEVVVYFPDQLSKIYQLAQWMPLLEQLHERMRVVVVCRDQDVFEHLASRTKMQVVFLRTVHALMALYDENDYKVALYVNNGVYNFQSLSSTRMMHAHICHGESDKLSMTSHSLKAYDRVLIAGQAAADRIATALMEMDQDVLVRIGRPQLDLPLKRALPESTHRTVLYAPTWEGRNAQNDYTSVGSMGLQIVRAALSVPDVRVVYRPHPRVPGSRDADVRATHRAIASAVERAAAQQPEAGHYVSLEGSILDTFAQTDLMITDVSSVAVDFLYLRVDRPIVITDRRADADAMHAASPMSRGADILTPAGLETLPALLERRLVDDDLRDVREEMRAYYFGDLAPGESTERFLSTVAELRDLRDALLEGRPPHPLSEG